MRRGHHLVEAVKQGQASLRAVGFSHGHRTVEPDHRRGREAVEGGIPVGDPSPIGVAGSHRDRVLGRDEGLQPNLGSPTTQHHWVGGQPREQTESIGDLAALPSAAVLVGQQHQPSGIVHPSLATRVLQQHQRQQRIEQRRGLRCSGIWLVQFGR